ncbi:nuclear cap-binding protein subunit, putative [Entamoeba dispar SAW760]|uniref:Nuclear cap-binding protein subunit 2 n=1 Tax=Entamoeba dispar (strain ATCC PRA-260 / SAW760) TaxID=370354 RepID=B0E8C6_ENTDS|nr:nuclear cap-binding protein subunit, putative [Entamoeba dispar SAW760]EDR29251.1 nuclear cap-binding protein subunit, putative [Entamoeba dispar SAW760]|eukprot:EDR29251.1 nuclear cap-binding protein subunit, putative [Entamoeba dispar SAW760]
MSELYITQPTLEYFDRESGFTPEQMIQKISTSTTLYVGNVSHSMNDKRVYTLFGRFGNINRVIMGVNHSNEPCGFCFVEFNKRNDAALAMKALDRTQVFGQYIRIDWDYGFVEGRQYGRGDGGEQKQTQRKRKFYNHSDNYRNERRFEFHEDNRRNDYDDGCEPRRRYVDEEDQLPSRRGDRRY